MAASPFKLLARNLSDGAVLVAGAAGIAWVVWEYRAWWDVTREMRDELRHVRDSCERLVASVERLEGKLDTRMDELVTAIHTQREQPTAPIGPAHAMTFDAGKTRRDSGKKKAGKNKRSKGTAPGGAS